MTVNVCFVYPWATFGGCERVFINRALAFKHLISGIHADFLFLHDAGGLTAFRSAVDRFQLGDVCSVVSSFDKEYDLVFLVDCPQAIVACEDRGIRYVVECHTGYSENRQYLQDISDTCELVLAPSEAFCERLRTEFPKLSGKLFELRNFVPWDIQTENSLPSIDLPRWSRKPILFFARMDALKDPVTLFEAFDILEKRRPGEFMMLLCGSLSPDVDVFGRLANNGLYGCSVVLPPVPFASAGALMTAVKQRGGIFVSPSRSESFGLSAAEAISSCLPVVLSKIDAHLGLVRGEEDRFTFMPGRSDELAARIESVFDGYQESVVALKRMREIFSASAFVSDWLALSRHLGFVR